MLHPSRERSPSNAGRFWRRLRGLLWHGGQWIKLDDTESALKASTKTLDRMRGL